MLSPEGISHTFDDRANGYGRGEGIGSLIVKRLSDAIRDGDTIRAVIRGSGTNADGKTPSITQPSSTAQAELITQTYEDAGLDQADTSYFECHGTGTPVGDPLELDAIATTLGAARRSAGRTPLYIGSIKPSVGHTEGCAGLAGVFKSILLLEKGMLVPTYGVERVNPKLKLADWHLSLPDGVIRWPVNGLRRISVNSFGFGGANAHVILDDAYHYMRERGLTGKHNTMMLESDSDSGLEEDTTLDATTLSNQGKKLVLFTGKDQAGPQRVASGIKSWLQSDSEDKRDSSLLDNLSYTLALRRTHHDNRTFTIASSLEELSEKLDKGVPAATRSQRHGQNLIMVFTGQGAQWASMGKELFEYEIFAQSVQQSQVYLESFGCTWDAKDEILKTDASNINRPEYSQPLCTVIQVAMVDLLSSWKIAPTATIGHSSGEIAAAYAASLLTHHDAIKLAFVRGISSQAVTKKGAMMAAGLSEDEAQVYLKAIPAGAAVVACINSPSSVTLSGDVEAIDLLETTISADGKFARKLKVTTAYHSPHMQEVSPKYLAMIGDIVPKEPEGDTVMYSSLTGRLVKSSTELDAEYWVNNMKNPVKFSQALLELLKYKKKSGDSGRPIPVQWGSVLEVGPHAALQGPIRQIIDKSNNRFAKSAPYASVLMRGKDAVETAMSAAGTLWAGGYKVDLEAVNQHAVNTCQMLCHLPTYPWSHTRGYWHESYASKSYRFPAHVRNDFLGIPEDAQNVHEPRWRNYLRTSENPWISHHVITGTVLYPGAGMLVMAIEAALRTADSTKTIHGFRLTNVSFERGLVISSDEESPLETRVSLHSYDDEDESWKFNVYSMTKGTSWTKHCAGTVAIAYETKVSEVEPAGLNARWDAEKELYQALVTEDGAFSIDVDAFYQNLQDIGMQYGPSFRNVTSLSAAPSSSASYGTVAVPNTKETMPKNYESPHVIHPATMDSIFHLTLASLGGGQPVTQSAVPYSIGEIYVSNQQPKDAGSLYSGYGRLLSQQGHEITTELIVSDEAWSQPLLTVKEFALRQVTSADKDLTASSDFGSIKNCAGLTWIPDLAFVSDSQDLASFVPNHDAATMANGYLDSIFMKQAGASALVVMMEADSTSLAILRSFRERKYTAKSVAAYAISEESLKMMHECLGQSSKALSISYSLVERENMLETLTRSKHDVFLGFGMSSNADKFASLAPVSCMTSTIELDMGNSGRLNTTSHSHDGVYLTISTEVTATLNDVPASIVMLLPATPSASLMALSEGMKNKLEGLGVEASVAELNPVNADSFTEKHVISLLEVDSPLVYSWGEDDFQAFKILISTVKHLFWIGHGSLLENWSSGVEFAATQGLFRVMRNEYPVAILPTLDLSATADIAGDKVSDIAISVWRNSLSDSADMEYAEKDGLVYVARATDDTGFDYELQLASNSAPPALASIDTSASPMRATKPDAAPDFVWVAEDLAPLQQDEVEVRVEYSAICPSQTLAVAQHAVGFITKIGDSVTKLEVGQKVVVFANETAKTHVRQRQDLVASLPSNLKPEEAVALVGPMVTAQYVLSAVGRLENGQVLLLDDAASLTGQALVQTANAIGAEVFALVQNAQERDIVISKLKVSPSHVFDRQRWNFVQSIQTATGSRGVDIIVSQQPGVHNRQAMTLMSDFGQFIDMGGKISLGSLRSSASNTSVSRINMAAAIEKRQSLISQLFQHAFGTYKLTGPSALTVLPATYLSDAISNSHSGSCVVSIHENTPVLVPAPPPDQLELDAEATYVLAGGLGALGLDVANWMIDCGAKHLVFLSRSGGSKNQAELDKFAKRSVTAEALKCDVNDASNVSKVFAALKSQGKRVGGVIQMAMVLEDGIFDNMSYMQWRRAIEPKTKGSRNLLANIWPGDKPFFILLSSITGVIGNTAQANYASGNTFEDALAQHARHHLGINATSIDVGLVSDSSHFTNAGEFGDLASYLGRYQHGWRGLQTNLGELGVAMRAIMRGSTTNGQAIPAQLVLGLGDSIESSEEAGGFSKDKKFELRVVKIGAETGDGSTKQNIASLLASATAMTEAASIVEESIRELVASSMGVSLDEVDSQKPLYDYGGKFPVPPTDYQTLTYQIVDSLQASEIRNRAQKNMKSDISVFDILSAMPLADVAAQIAAKSKLVKVTAVED